MTDDLRQRIAEALYDTYGQQNRNRSLAIADTVLSVLDDEAAERWIQQQLDQTGIRSMDFRNGMEMELEPARELLAHWVAAARTMLGDAPNYTETPVTIDNGETLSMDVKVAESPEMYTLTVQRHAPDALTPHQARMKAEAELTQLRTTIARVEAYAHELPHKDSMGLLACLDAPRPCRCGHPKDQHSEADEPVSVGLCHECDEDGSDDAWHNYEPQEQQ
ncbi:hypothetical protein AB0B07_33225 [Streptomyces sioyaensis]|uniref:hypothetical protein n=1 Tax=Streptomyces sioyaensis TaxID=67364 RepID=UPI0033F5F9C4